MEQNPQLENDNLPELQNLLSEARTAPEKQKQEIISKFYDKLEEGLAARELHVASNKDFWVSHHNQGLFIRRESPEAVLGMILSGKIIPLNPEKENYANAAVDSDEGAAIAWNEGQNGVEIATMIGFRAANDAVRRIEQSENELRNPKRLASIRSIKGGVQFKEVAHVIMRTPSSIFPKERLEEWEDELLDIDKKKLPYIFRSIEIPHADPARKAA
ncbi:MAG: hypothetical protein HYT12_04570 [Candidatus Liptonbacteria bacterium]|nr:hypothetical protein [Candidatus Liptonbacteria bacterium]